jgi:hypothetical protein
MQLSPHFSLREMTATSHRSLLAENMEQGKAFVPQLTKLCVGLLEPIRTHFAAPVSIHSGYRCPALNTAIGGSKTSAHMRGEAADFHVVGKKLEDVWSWVWKESGLTFDQLILEGWAVGAPTWIHIATGTRKQVLTFEAGRYTRVA